MALLYTKLCNFILYIEITADGHMTTQINPDVVDLLASLLLYLMATRNH